MSARKELYRAEQLPVFQNRVFLTADKARNCIKGDVVLVQDTETGLIFNQAFKSELMQYDTDYQNEQAVSSIFRGYLNEITGIIRKHFHNHTLIEIGCGKGFFLEQLLAQGFQITGFDPTYEGSSPNVIRQYFSPQANLRVGGIILRHVLEHVQDPVAFLTRIRDSNGGGGKIYIEVPCFDWICKRRAWFDIFYEHVNYFRNSDFRRMFARVHESGHTFGGQYLYVVADLSTVRTPKTDGSDFVDFPPDLVDSVGRYADRLKAQRLRQGTPQRSIIWGGASKGVIFALFMQRAGATVDFVVDINPAKQGKYLAATGLKVCSPEEMLSGAEPGSNIIVMNGNYLSEIRALTHNQFNYLTADHESI